MLPKAEFCSECINKFKALLQLAYNIILFFAETLFSTVPSFFFLPSSFIIQAMPAHTTLWLKLVLYSSSKSVPPNWIWLHFSKQHSSSISLQPHLSRDGNAPNSQRFTHWLCSINKCKFSISMHKHKTSYGLHLEIYLLPISGYYNCYCHFKMLFPWQYNNKIHTIL